MPMLKTALEKQVLRQTGAVYQFRHADLQDRLAERYEAGMIGGPSASPGLLGYAGLGHVVVNHIAVSGASPVTACGFQFNLNSSQLSPGFFDSAAGLGGLQREPKEVRLFQVLGADRVAIGFG
jgi:hypothetical protein